MLLTGYGTKPLRPIGFSIFIITLASVIITFRNNNFWKSLQSSFEAFLTITISNTLIGNFKWLFIIEGFIGVFSIGLFLGTLLNIWFSEK
jgi:hypothetical protein